MTLSEILSAGRYRRYGVRIMATCPKCGHQTLSVDTAKQLYHCFHAGCTNDGRLSAEPWQSQQPHFKQPTALIRKAVTEGEAPMEPQDYKGLSAAVLASVHPIDDTAPQLIKDYLTAIHIDLETASAMGVGYRDGDIAYVNYVTGRPVNVKFRSVVGKHFSQESPTTPCAPYNIDCLWPDGDTQDAPSDTAKTNLGNVINTGRKDKIRLIVTEGEKDVLTVRQAGYTYVVSVPNGAGSDLAKSFEAFVPWIERVGEVVLCGDTDRPGRTLVMNLEKYFGAKSRRVVYPDNCKDISEVNAIYGIEMVRSVIDNARFPSTSDIVSVGELSAQVLRRLHGDYDHGFSLGYGPEMDKVFKLTDLGGLVVVTGQPNAGKTDFLNDVCARLVFKCDRSVCLCSFEMPDKAAHTSQLVRLGFGRRDLSHITAEQLQPMIDHLSNHLSILDLMEYEPTVENILMLADRVLQKQPMHMLVVDPFLFLTSSFTVSQRETETERIKHILTTFQTWGRKNHVWVTVVAHPRKLNKVDGKQLEKIDMYTIAGSANWANLGDYIISIERVHEEHIGGTAFYEIDYSRLNVMKVRDQEVCSCGYVYLRRQPCGRYDERKSKEECESECRLEVFPPSDTAVWLCARQQTLTLE